MGEGNRADSGDGRWIREIKSKRAGTNPALSLLAESIQPFQLTRLSAAMNADATQEDQLPYHLLRRLLYYTLAKLSRGKIKQTESRFPCFLNALLAENCAVEILAESIILNIGRSVKGEIKIKRQKAGEPAFYLSLGQKTGFPSSLFSVFLLAEKLM